jgi:hypothetical protein
VIEGSAFRWCSSLSAICIPPSVVRIYRECFSQCKALLSVAFEPASQLSWIEGSVFSRCPSLSSIRISPSLQPILGEYVALLTMSDPEAGLVATDQPNEADSES